jgi:RimJ/RimL family protein N-acetyltransferase
MIEYKPIEENDLKEMIEFRNKHYQYLRQWKLLSLYEQTQWYKNLDRNRHLFYKVDLSNYENIYFIGVPEPKVIKHIIKYYIGFTYIDWVNRVVELSFITDTYIDDNTRDILDSMTEYAFNNLNMYKVFIEIYDFDLMKKKLLEKTDFKKECELIDNVWYKGKYHNSIRYYLIRA